MSTVDSARCPESIRRWLSSVSMLSVMPLSGSAQGPISDLRYPLVIARRSTLVVASAGFFDGIGQLSSNGSMLDINVSADGRAWLHWILDAQGSFHALKSEGVQPATWLQAINLRRRQERFRLLPPVKVTASRLLSLISDLSDEFTEAPNVTDLRRLLSGLPPDAQVTGQQLTPYFGEDIRA